MKNFLKMNIRLEQLDSAASISDIEFFRKEFFHSDFPSPNLQLILNSILDEFWKKVRDCIVSGMVDLVSDREVLA